jgi:small subunit ribosomal protein S6
LREYEIMLILPAEADEALVQTAMGRIEKIVGEHGGAVGTIDRWGRRRFAFEIDHQHEGYYVIARFNADPAIQAELERTLNLADEVIRHKVLALPPGALKPPKPRYDRSAAAPAASARPAASAPATQEPERTQDKDQDKDKDASPAPA